MSIVNDQWSTADGVQENKNNENVHRQNVKTIVNSKRRLLQINAQSSKLTAETILQSYDITTL
jgi:hypothetical protein